MRRILGVLFAAALFIALGTAVAFATGVNVEYGSPGNSCIPAGTGWKTNTESTAILNAGDTITGVWVKAGPNCVQIYPTDDSSCYDIVVSGNTATATKVGTGPDCKDISHLEGTYTSAPPPVDCVVSEWSEWSACVQGSQSRTRTIITPASNGGQACPALTETRTCETPPTDLCTNLEGIQETMPPGYEDPDQDGICTLIPPPPTDLCTNLEGVQTVMPEGYEDPNQDGICTLIPPPPTDVCPNIEGVQETVPPGLIIDDEGNCVEPPAEVCEDPAATNYGGPLPCNYPPPQPPSCNPDKKIWVWTLFDANGIAYTLRDLGYDGTYDAPGVDQQCYYFGCDFVAVKAWGRWVSECDSAYAYWRTLPSGAGGGKCPLPDAPSQ